MTLDEEIQLLKRALDRERAARAEAESILETKSRELFVSNERLTQQFGALLRQTAEIEFLNKITSLSLEECDLGRAVSRFMESVCELCQWPTGKMHIPVVNIRGETELKSGGKSSKTAYSTKEMVWQEQAVAVPIVVGDEVVAVAEFPIEVPQREDSNLSRIVKTGALQLGTILERDYHEKETWERNEKLEVALRSLKETQMQLIHSEKMASIGTIAAGVAHEVNNPISYVLSNISTLKEYSKTLVKFVNSVESNPANLKELREKLRIDSVSKDIEQLIQECVEGAQRVKETVQALKSFSRIDETEFKEADINECIETSLKLIWNEIKFKCDLTKSLGKLPSVYCNPGQLNQVLLNLLLNAVQSIEGKGKITISSRLHGDCVEVSVKDTGIGISKEQLPKIFTPFYSTKPVGQGTGLGLSISYGIIKNHGGSITVDSSPGVGSTFTFSFPIRSQTEITQEKKANGS